MPIKNPSVKHSWPFGPNDRTYCGRDLPRGTNNPQDAPTTERQPNATALPWFPLDEPTEAGREWAQRDNTETQAATPHALKEMR